MSLSQKPLIIRDCNQKNIKFLAYDTANNNDNSGVLYASESINQMTLKLPLICVFDMVAEHHNANNANVGGGGGGNKMNKIKTYSECLVMKVRCGSKPGTVKLIVTNSYYSGGNNVDLMVIRHSDVTKVVEEYRGRHYCFDGLLVYATPPPLPPQQQLPSTYMMIPDFTSSAAARCRRDSGKSSICTNASYISRRPKHQQQQEKQLMILPAESKLSLPLRYSITLVNLFWMIVKFVIRISSLYFVIASISWYYYDDYTHLPNLIQAYSGPLALHFIHNALTGADGSVAGDDSGGGTAV